MQRTANSAFRFASCARVFRAGCFFERLSLVAFARFHRRYRIEDRFDQRCIVQGAMKAVGLAIALLVVAPLAYGQTAERSSFKPVSARHCPDQDAFSLERPDRDGGPTKVGFAVRIRDIIALDDAEQSMQLDMYSLFQWLDPRLANSLRAEASVACPLPLDRMWTPHVQVVNLRSKQKLYEDITLVDGEGLVSLIRREILEVAVPLDYREFPLMPIRCRFRFRRLSLMIVRSSSKLFRV